jgi:hypothetical protein
MLRNGESILGFIGRIPTLFQQNGKTVTAFNVTTWRVLAAYRNQSMKLLFQFLKSSQGHILLDTTPDPQVAKILERSGFRPLPVNDLRYSFALLNPEKFLPHFLAPFFRLWQAFRLKKIQSPLETKQVLKADSSFDELWERTKQQYSNTNIRTSAVLNWYCFGNQNSRKEIFGCYRNDQLQGHAICWGRQTKRFKEFECVDLWVDAGDENATQSLISVVLRHAREHSYDLVLFPHFNSKLAGIFQKKGLFQRKLLRGDRYLKWDGLPPDLSMSYFVNFQGDYGL